MGGMSENPYETPQGIGDSSPSLLWRELGSWSRLFFALASIASVAAAVVWLLDKFVFDLR
jgi:hypothetical protein